MRATLLSAEEKGITQANFSEMAGALESPRVARLLGAKSGMGVRLRLHDTWVFEMIVAMDNFGEIYDRNLGQKGPYRQLTQRPEIRPLKC